MILSLVLVSACQIQTVGIKDQAQIQVDRRAALKSLEGFAVKSIDVDYMASCKARIITGVKTYSGSCQITVTHNLELQLIISHPLGGTILALYADQSLIQLNDYSEKRYYEFSYADKKKMGVPIIKDLSIAELQTILWGRLTEEAGKTLVIKLKNEKPLQLIKHGKEADLIVAYKSWLIFEGLEFPKILEVSNPGDKSAVKLVITSFSPGSAGDLKLKKPLLLEVQPDES